METLEVCEPVSKCNYIPKNEDILSDINKNINDLKLEFIPDETSYLAEDNDFDDCTSMKEFEIKEKKTKKYADHIIFISQYHFKCSCITCGRKKENKLIKNLMLQGILVLYPECNDFIQNYSDCKFNDNYSPDLNVLYIRLTDNKYYTDICYPQKKTEIEREILLFLTPLLGGSSVTYNLSISNEELMNVNQSLNAGVIEESINIHDLEKENTQFQRGENYGNTGSPILLESNTWKECKKKIKEIFSKIEDTSIISYEYFRNNSELYTFAYKRFLLQLTDYTYKIIEDRTSEKSAQVRFILDKWGGVEAQLEINQNISKTYEYKIKFYTRDLLKDSYYKKKLLEKYEYQRNNDIFARLRHEYEINRQIMKKYWPDWNGEEKPMYKEVICFTKKLQVNDILEEWFQKDKHNRNILLDQCHYFKSKEDVIIWLKETLHINIDIDIYCE